ASGGISASGSRYFGISSRAPECTASGLTAMRSFIRAATTCFATVIGVLPALGDWRAEPRTPGPGQGRRCLPGGWRCAVAFSRVALQERSDALTTALPRPETVPGPAVALANVTRVFGSTPAVVRVDLTVERGHLVVL